MTTSITDKEFKMFEHYFTGNKPSKQQVLKVIKTAITQGYNKFEISWGENMIEIESYNGRYVGYGWIKNLSGQDIAKEI